MELSQFKTVEQLAAAIKTLDMVTSVAWTDYSGSSTIVGWTSYTTQEIWYKKIGKFVFVTYDIRGVSDDTVASFTVPFTNSADVNVQNIIWTEDDSSWVAGLQYLNASSATSTHLIGVGQAWTNSGDKSIIGQFWYEAA